MFSLYTRVTEQIQSNIVLPVYYKNKARLIGYQGCQVIGRIQPGANVIKLFTYVIYEFS